MREIQRGVRVVRTSNKLPARTVGRKTLGTFLNFLSAISDSESDHWTVTHIATRSWVFTSHAASPMASQAFAHRGQGRARYSPNCGDPGGSGVTVSRVAEHEFSEKESVFLRQLALPDRWI